MAETKIIEICAKFSTVLSFKTTEKKASKEAEKAVDAKISCLLSECRREQKKFVDPDFGPLDDDEDGARAMYGNPPVRPGAPGSSQYPDPTKLRWSRPNYKQTQRSSHLNDSSEGNDSAEDNDDDNDQSDTESTSSDDYDESTTPLCEDGQLFVDGSSSGDVIQGSLGDCWFLGALAVLATHPAELERVFYRGDMYRDCGLFCCRFYKDDEVKFVIVDDRLPVYNNKNAGLVFAKCRDVNELWVPLVEKAYAKLHGCYKSLIGGYVHYGLSDLTGRMPRLIVTKAGYPGYVNDNNSSGGLDGDKLWRLLVEYKSWGCLLGCSIQPVPSADKQQHKAEAEVGNGLRMMHAYSLVDLGQLDDGNRLVRLRNPWGFGEWTGPWSDESKERLDGDDAIKRVFDTSSSESTTLDTRDGTFFMLFNDWLSYFSHVFVAISFPSSWHQVTISGRWDDDESGGSRSMVTWNTNPKIAVTIGKSSSSSPAFKRVFVSISIPDFRLSMGNEYYKAPLGQIPISFDIIQDGGGDVLKVATSGVIQGSADIKYNDNDNDSKSSIAGDGPNSQPPYYFASVQTDLYLQEGSYFIVPSTFKRQIIGQYFVTVYCETDVNVTSSKDEGPVTAVTAVVKSSSLPLPTSQGQPSTKKLMQDEIKQPDTSSSSSLALSRSLARRFQDCKDDLLTQARQLNLSQSFIIKELLTKSNIIKQLQGGGNKMSSSTNNSMMMMFGEVKKRLSSIGLSVSSYKIDDFAYLLFMSSDASTTATADSVSYDDRSMFDLNMLVKEIFGVDDDATAAAMKILSPPAPPDDDLQYQPCDLSGILHVKIINGKSIKPPQLWTDVTVAVADDDDVLGDDGSDRNVIDAKLLEALTMNARRRWQSLSSFGNDEDDTTLSTGKSRRLIKLQLRQSSLAVAKEKMMMNSNDDDDNDEKEEMIYVSHDDDDDDELMLDVTSPAHHRQKQSRTSLADAVSPLKMKNNDDDDDKKAMMKNDAIIHTTDFFKRIESKRSNFFSINSTHSRRGFLCIDCGRTGTEFQCTRRGCNNGFCSDCFNKLASDEQMCEKCFDSIAVLSNASQVVAMTKPDVKKLKKNVDENDYAWIGRRLTDSAPLSSSCCNSLIDGIIDKSCLIADYRVRSIIQDLTKKEELLTARKSLNSSRKSLRDEGKNSKSRDGMYVNQTPNIHQLDKTLASAASLTSVQRSYSRTPSKLVNSAVVESFKSKTNLMNNNDDAASVYSYSKTTSRGGQHKYHSMRPIFKRLVPITCFDNNNSSLDADGVISTWFSYFDQDCNGVISFSEFKAGLKDLNLKLSEEEYKLLMSRFDSRNNDGNIDAKEFKNFFKSCSTAAEKQQTNLEVVIGRVKFNQQLCEFVKSKRNDQIEADLSNSLFMSADKSQAVQSSTAINDIAKQHLVTDDDVCRLFIACCQSVNVLTKLINDSSMLSIVPSCLGKLDASQFETAVHSLVDLMRDIINQRSSGSTSTSDGLSSSWTNIVSKHIGQANLDSTKGATNSSVPVDVVVDYLISEMSEYISKKPNSCAAIIPGELNKEDVEMICQVTASCCADRILSSNWNIVLHDGFVSYLGFCSFVIHSKLSSVEKKLLMTMQQCVDLSKSAILHLVTVLMSANKKTIVIDVYEPYSGSQYVMHFDFDFFFLKWPVGAFAVTTPLHDSGSIDVPTFCKELDPAENEIMLRLCSRLNLVNVGTSKEIRLVEDERFLNHLRKLFHQVSLPFFVSISTVELSFLVNSSESSKDSSSSSLRKVVFGGLKQSRSLCSFMRNCHSSLRVCLRKYDCKEVDSMSWKEFGAHLLGSRSPYASVELLPHVSQVVNDSIPSLIDSFIAPSSKRLESSRNSTSDDGSGSASSSSAAEVLLLQTSVDSEGGSYPTWNSKMQFPLEPPKYLTKQVLTSDIHRMQIDGVIKFVVVMIREWSRGQVFGTVYDPKTAKDYMLEGVPAMWKKHGYFLSDGNDDVSSNSTSSSSSSSQQDSNALKEVDADLYEDLTSSNTGQANSSSIDKDCRRWLNGPVSITDIQRQINIKSAKGKLRIGPCITPSIVIGVYNQLPKQTILIGSCQLSLSTALSSAGVLHQQWATITDANGNDSGRIMIEFSFNRLDQVSDEKIVATDVKPAKKDPVVVAAAATRLEAKEEENVKQVKPVVIVDSSLLEAQAAKKMILEQKEKISEMTRTMSDISKQKIDLEKEKRDSIARQVELENQLSQEKEELKHLQQAANSLRMEYNTLINQQEEKAKQSPMRPAEVVSSPPKAVITFDAALSGISNNVTESQLKEINSILMKMNAIYQSSQSTTQQSYLTSDIVFHTWSMVTSVQVGQSTIDTLSRHYKIGSSMSNSSSSTVIDFKQLLQDVASVKGIVLSHISEPDRQMEKKESNEQLSSREIESQEVSDRLWTRRNNLSRTWESSDGKVPELPISSDHPTLPPGWESRTAPNGKTYYIDHTNKITTWVHPSMKLSSEEKNSLSLSAKARDKILSNDRISEPRQRAEAAQKRKKSYI